MIYGAPPVWRRRDVVIGDDWQFTMSATTPLPGTTTLTMGNTYLVNNVATVLTGPFATVSAWAISLGNNPCISLPFDLTGWVPGGNLILPQCVPPLSLNIYFDDSQLALGVFVLTVPRDVTATLVPDETAYRIQVTLTDPYDTLKTCLIIPLRVSAV